MSPDWFDPFGLRGSKLDPLTHLKDVLQGRGIAAESLTRFSTGMAKQLQGRRLEVASRPPVAATVVAVDEVRPPAAVDAAASGVVAEMSLFASIRAALADVRIGAGHVDGIDLTARDLRLRPPGDRLVVGGVEFEARLASERALAQVAERVEGRAVVRLDRGRIEVCHPRARWLWVELSVRVERQQIIARAVAARFRGWEIPVPRILRRAMIEHEPLLPAALMVDEVGVEGSDVVARGRVAGVTLPVDVVKLMTDLGTTSARSVLPVVGDW